MTQAPLTTIARTLELQAWNTFLALDKTNRKLLAGKAYARYERRTRLTNQVRMLEQKAAT